MDRIVGEDYVTEVVHGDYDCVLFFWYQFYID